PVPPAVFAAMPPLPAEPPSPSPAVPALPANDAIPPLGVPVPPAPLSDPPDPPPASALLPEPLALGVPAVPLFDGRFELSPDATSPNTQAINSACEFVFITTVAYRGSRPPSLREHAITFDI